MEKLFIGLFLVSFLPLMIISLRVVAEAGEEMDKCRALRDEIEREGK